MRYAYKAEGGTLFIFDDNFEGMSTFKKNLFIMAYTIPVADFEEWARFWNKVKTLSPTGGPIRHEFLKDQRITKAEKM